MKLSKDEMDGMRRDGKDPKRRAHFRKGRPLHPLTFEDFIAALDELQTLAPAPERPRFVRYSNVRL